MSDVLWHTPELRKELQENYTPAIEPVWYGGHLLHAWHLLRDQGLFWPWYRRNKSGILRQEPYVDPEMVHLRLVNLFKAPLMWRLAYQSHFCLPHRGATRSRQSADAAVRTGLGSAAGGNAPGAAG